MSKTWSYTRVPPAARPDRGGPRTGSRGQRRVTRSPRAPALFPASYLAGASVPDPAEICDLSLPRSRRCTTARVRRCNMRETPSALDGAGSAASARRVRAGGRGPGRRDRGPRATVGASRYVSGSARAAGRGKLNGIKKTPGISPRGVVCGAGPVYSSGRCRTIFHQNSAAANVSPNTVGG